ncbi:MAG: hypothetical protein J4N33_03310, partial [Chloroflexi bacterium]|nr:hypothetical protein [Chloroflexota bacterium]
PTGRAMPAMPALLFNRKSTHVNQGVLPLLGGLVNAHDVAIGLDGWTERPKFAHGGLGFVTPDRDRSPDPA